MIKYAGLKHPPVFCPVVDDYYKGMATTIMLHTSQLKGVTTLAAVRQIFEDHYAGQSLVHVETAEAGKLYANAKAGDNDLTIVVAGNDQQFTVTALFDNLGKGASGAAVQLLNLKMDADMTAGLVLQEV